MRMEGAATDAAATLSMNVCCMPPPPPPPPPRRKIFLLPPAMTSSLHHHRTSHSLILVLPVFLILLSGVLAGAVLSGRPEIFPHREEIILQKGESLNLTCRASHPVAWCSDYTFNEEQYEELFEVGHEKPYTSILSIGAVNVSHVGYFSCVFNTTENKEKKNCNVSDPSISSIYLYVKDLSDPKNLLVAHKNTFIDVYVGETVVLPCKPTFPEVEVVLSKNYDSTDPCEDCVYDAKTGYTMEAQDDYYNFICIATYEGKTQSYDLIIKTHKLSAQKPNMPSVDVEGVWQEDTRGDTDFIVYYVTEGSSVNLTCTYQSDVQSSGIKLEWSNNTLNESGTHRIIRQPGINRQRKSRYYEISNAAPIDSGIYTCWAITHNKRSEPAKLNLIVVAKDATYINTSIFHPNVTEPVEADSRVEWEILVIAHPEPVFKWKKDGKVLRDSTRTNSRDQSTNYEMELSLRDGTLFLSLHHPTLSDNGKYTLEASLPNTTITKTTTMYLMIPGKPQKVQIRSPNDSQMFKEGDKFSLKCSAEGYPKPNISLHFSSYNRTNTFSNSNMESRVYNQVREEDGMNDDDETSSLVERNVHWMGVAQEPGYYHCRAENELGTEISIKKPFLVTDGEQLSLISLKVEVGSEVQGQAGKSVTVVEGANLTVVCRANKMYTKEPLTWTLNGAPLSSQSKEMWGMEVTDEETRLSQLSTLRAPMLKRVASSFTIACSGKEGNHTSLKFWVQEMVKPTWRGGVPPKTDHEKNKNEDLTLSCPVDGNPPPKVVWKKGDQTLKESHRYKIREDNHQLFIPILLPSDDGRYMCEITNRAGNLSSWFNVVVRDPDTQEMVIILGVVGVLIVALVVLSVFFCRKIYQARKETLNLQLQEQKMFIEGDPSSLNPDISLEQQAELLPYNTKYEVSRDSIIFDKLLGAGAFGRVYSATALNLLPGEARTTVAVKMIKSRTDCAQLKALRSEVKIMIHIGRHINIVNLLGACSKDLASKGELLLLVEYCRYGNILDYLRRHRREFVNQINDEDKIDPGFFSEQRFRHRSDSSSRHHGPRGLKYAHLNFHQDNVFYGNDQVSDGTTGTPTSLMPPCRNSGEAGGMPFRSRTVSASSNSHQIASDNSILPSETSAGTSDGYLSAQSLNGSKAPLCSTDILGWAYQIAKGMEYLAFKKVLHGDLAARNVLLAENNVVKISDFGLAKDIYKNDNYKKKSSGPVPVKWLAVECLREGVFSTQSDVWSFGVVLWEIFSLGQVPYSCTEFDENFILKLEKGVRLEQPRYATYSLYRLMLECWNYDPMERPSFTSLEASLGEMLGEAQRQNYLELTEPYQQDNSSSEFLDLLPSQDYSTKVRETSLQLTEDGYEMPFSPGVPTEAMGQGDRLSMASRLTSRQMEYLQVAATDDSHSTYLQMSTDRTDTRTVFDFDNETVACIMGRPEEQETVDRDLYLKMDKTPQSSPAPNTPNSVPSGREESPLRLVLKSISSQGSQRRGRHPSLTKHDSGVYSPTVMTQTNPGYMTMSQVLPTDEHKYVNNKETSRINCLLYSPSQAKVCDYLDDGKCTTEYANLLPRDSDRDRTISESSSGVGSIEGGSPPRDRENNVLKCPPVLEEAIVV